MIDYANKAMTTLHHFKVQHERALQRERNQSNNLSRVREKYMSKIKDIETITKAKQRKIKKLEEAELSILNQLKNTTMLHNYVQSKFEEAFWPGLSISSHFGKNIINVIYLV